MTVDSLPAIWNLRHSRPSPPTLRSEELQRVHEALEATSRATVREEPPGGWGATQIATRYAYAHTGDYSLVWWLEGNHPAVMRLQFAQLATALRMARGDREAHCPTVEEARDALASHSGWLLVVHNLQHPDTLETLLPAARTGHVLVTCDVCDDADATLSPLAPEAAAVLSESLPEEWAATGHPLVCKLAASAAKTLGNAPSRNSGTSDVPDAILTLVDGVTEWLRNSNVASLDFATLCAFFDTTDIPLELFDIDTTEILSTRLSGALSLPNGLQALLNPLETLGWINVRKYGLSMHPLLATVLRDRLADTPRTAWATAAVRLIHEAFPKADHYETPNGFTNRLVPIGLTARRHAAASDTAPGTRASLNYWLGLYIHGVLSAEDAVPFYRDSVEASLTLYGEDNPIVATRINSLGVAEMDCGNLEKAKDCFERAFAICDHLFGAKDQAVYVDLDESMLTIPIRNLCTVIEAIGNPKEAQRTYERAMQVFLDVHGWSHSLVAECANLFGNSWYRMQKLEKACSCYEKAVAAEEAAASSNSDSLATYLNNLGRTLHECHRHEDAVPRLEHALRLKQRGETQPDEELALILVNLAKTLRSRSRWDESERHFREALHVLSKLPQADANARVSVLSQLGSLKLSQDLPDQALTYFQETLAALREADPPVESSIIREQVNLGRAYAAAEQYEEATKTFEEALDAARSQEIPAPALEATIRYRMGRCLEKQDLFAEALQAFEIAMRLDTRATGPRSEPVARDAFAAGSILAKMGDNMVAIGNLRLALEIYENTVGRDHSRTRRVRAKLESLG